MATSFSSPGLVKAASEALLVAQPELNIARLFANDMSGEFADVGTTVKVPLVTSGAVSDFNIDSNDYETALGSIAYATVTLNKQPKATMEFKGADLLEAPNAPYWTKCATAMANKIKVSISSTLGGLFTTTACTGGGVAVASVTKNAIAKLRQECVGRINETVLALAPDYFADLLSLLDSNVYGGISAIQKGYIENLYGFKAVVPMYDLPNGVKGALIGQDTVAIASRSVPVADQHIYTEYGTASDDFGFTLTMMRHGSAAKGKAFLNATCLWGVSLVKPAEIKYIAASV